MIGLAIGLAAIGYFAYRHRRHHHHHHAWAHRGCHRRARGYHVMSILGTTPGQEKVIREEADLLRERARLAQDEVAAARGDLADVLRAETFDRARFEATLGRVDAAWAQLKAALADSVGRVHDTLDARQRERLADLIASKRGPSFGPFR